MEAIKNQVKSYMPWLLGVASLMSFIAISDLPYGYYTLLRLVIFTTGIIYLLFFRNEKLPIIDLLVFFVVLVWNPVIPIYLNKVTWMPLNLMVSIGAILLIFHIIKK